MNNDGVDDLMVGAPANGVGTVNVAPFYGHATNMVAGTPLALYHQTLATGDRFGTSLAVAGGELAVGELGHRGLEDVD